MGEGGIFYRECQKNIRGGFMLLFVKKKKGMAGAVADFYLEGGGSIFYREEPVNQKGCQLVLVYFNIEMMVMLFEIEHTLYSSNFYRLK